MQLNKSCVSMLTAATLQQRLCVVPSNHLSIPHQSGRNPRPPWLSVDWQLVQKAPLALSFPSFLLPVVDGAFRKPLTNIDQTFIVRHCHKYILVRIKLLQALDALLSHWRIIVPTSFLFRDFVVRRRARIFGIGVAGGENRAWAWMGEAMLVEGNRLRDSTGHGSVRGWPKRAAVMTNVTTHKNKRLRCGASKT